MVTSPKHWVVAVGCLALACIGPGGAQSEAPRTAPSTPTRDAAARRGLASCLERYERDDYSAARRAANAALTSSEGLTPRLVAQLHGCQAWSAYFGGDEDAAQVLAAGIRAWERVPSADEDLANLTLYLGQQLALVEADLAGAEANFRRAIAHFERRHGANDWHLVRGLFGLYDVLDQECRSGEASATLTRLEALYPGDAQYNEWYPKATARFRSMLARRQGDLARARAELQVILPELDGPKVDRVYASTAYGSLADYAREGGHYADALKFAEIAAARAEPKQGQHELLDLALAYRAAGDARLAEHERRYFLRRSSAGQDLFVTPLRPLQACAAETGSAPRGWLREDAPYERVDSCIETTGLKPAPGASLSLLMRIEQGRVVASEAVGKMFEPALLDCVAQSALSLSYPGPHHFNFRSIWYVQAAPVR